MSNGKPDENPGKGNERPDKPDVPKGPPSETPGKGPPIPSDPPKHRPVG